MFVSETRKIVEAENFLREYFKQQKTPTLRDLILYLETLDSVESFTEPFLKLENHGVVEYEAGSANKHNTMVDAISDDLITAYDNILINAEENDDYYNNNYSRLSQILGQLKGLEGRVNSLLSLTGLTDGYFKVIDDVFTTEEFIDKESTTAAVDITTQTVTISDSTENLHTTTLSQTSRYFPDFSSSSSATVSFGVLDKANLVSSAMWGGCESYKDAFQDEEKPWKQKIITTSASGITGILKIDLKEEAELTTIVFRKNFAGERGVTSVNIMYSTDGVSYNYIPSGIEEYTLGDVAFATFPTTKMRYIKFFINKYHPDEVLGSNYIYYIGANIIEFYNKVYSSDEIASADFVSTARETLDIDGVPYPILWVGIEVCEVTDSNNYIEYYVSFDSGTTFYPIAPFSSVNPRHPKSISVASTEQDEKTDVVVPVISNSTAYSLYPTTPDLDSYYFYPGKDSSYNVPLGLIMSEDSTPQLDVQYSLSNKISVYRNVGKKAYYGYGCYQFETIEVPRGWRFDGSSYITIVTLNKGNKLTIDFGPQAVFINGTKVVGVYNFTEGDYEIRIKPISFLTPVNNTAPLSSTWSITEVVSEDGIGTFTDRYSNTYTDTLFPYNQRLLVEGFNYGEDYTGVVRYRGFDRFSAYKMTKVPELTFTSDVSNQDYTKFMAVLGQFNTSQVGYIVLKHADDVIIDKDRTKEYFDVVAGIYTDDNYYAESVVFKATLYSTNGSTPVFSGYRLKLGVTENGS